ncbi:MAG: 4'-phosphopantetheinyl transferase family protein [Acidobacteriaceae bacterium]
MDSSIPSPASTARWQLHPRHVHIWLWQVASSPLDPNELNTLDASELRRAERFRPPIHRAQWVRSHTGMRQILSGYLHCQPADVVFRRGPNGKPFLEKPAPDAPNPPHFNLSHSHDWCALAVASQLDLGIDIQVPHTVNPSLWRRVLTPQEKSQIITLQPEDRDPAFFRCWTRKEAIGKADSQGVYLHLKQTETGLLPLPVGNIIHTATNTAGTPTPWHVTDLTLPAGLYGAIATAAPVTLELRTLPALTL